MKSKVQSGWDVVVDLAETILLALLTALGWTSMISLFPVGSQGYWEVWSITTAYLVLLLVKFVRKWAFRTSNKP